MTELNKATVVPFLTVVSGFSGTFETCEFCFLFSSCTLLMKDIRTDNIFRFTFIVY